MARAIVVGHGGFDKGSEHFLVPAGTTITFLADAGSPLGMPFKPTGPIGFGWEEGVNCHFDYEKLADLLSRFLQAEEPLVAGKVVPNMSTEALSAKSAEVAQKVQDAGKWGAEKFKNTPASLCTGTAASCPTPALNAAQLFHDAIAKKGEDALLAFKSFVGAGGTGPLPEVLAEFSGRLADIPPEYHNYVVDGVPEQRWKHDCKGLLTEFAGCDIVWVSCSGFEADQDTLDELGLPDGLPEEITRTTEAPGAMGSDFLRDLTDTDLNGMRALRLEKFNDTPLGKSIPIRASAALVVLGSDYTGNIETHIKRQDDLEEGTVTKKSDAFGKKLKSIEVKGISTTKQERVRGVMEAVAPGVAVNFV